jgi:Flp pilus assembly protein protease CpaA
MIPNLPISSVLSILTVLVLLSLYSYLDIRNRQVSNSAVLLGGALAFLVVVFSGHLQARLLLHFSAVIFVPLSSYLLFRIGALGGADVKILSIAALVSPGFELIDLANPLFESVLSACIQMFIMLLGGYLYVRISDDKDQSISPPLIPFLLGGYIVIQLLTLV